MNQKHSKYSLYFYLLDFGVFHEKGSVIIMSSLLLGKHYLLLDYSIEPR